MYDAQTLIENIKKQAKKKNVLIRDMLSECGLSINAINQITDKKGLSSFSLAKIADFLDCSVDYLLGRSKKDIVIELNNIYDELNEDGKSKVKDYINDLLANPAYITKSTENDD